MREIKRICVNCGSNFGTRDEYREAAKELGAFLATRGIDLVYGGAYAGLMGVLADAVLGGGGKVTGVITEYLNEKVGHPGLTELIVVSTMHERKETMFKLSDAFIALPGGFGTLEEMFEILTWGQLGHHVKPCGLLNVCGYYDKLLAFLDHGVDSGFIRREHRSMLMSSGSAESLFTMFEGYDAPCVGKWIKDHASEKGK